MHLLRSLFTAAVCLTAVASGQGCDTSGVDTFARTFETSPSNAQWESCEEGFDGPKISPINSTSVDWWYFDAVSHDHTASLVIVFFLRAPQAGFPGPDWLNSTTYLQVTGSYSNGTLFLFNIDAEEVIISTSGQGSNGLFRGAGFEWSGAPDLSEYEITMNHTDIRGTFRLRSVAPPHLACGPMEVGESLEVMPNVGWANSIPDADATVDIEILGSPLNFEGVGYHDKNWASTPFNESVESWTWGHGRMGPYSIVWLDSLDRDHENYRSGYVALDGKIISAECNTMTVRPAGANSTYPPEFDSGIPERLEIEANLENGQVLRANLTSNVIVFRPLYFRWVGTISGTISGVLGSQTFDGPASYEMFNFLEEWGYEP